MKEKNLEQTNPLLSLIWKRPPDLLEQVRKALEAGADPGERGSYSQTPLRVTSNVGRFDIVKLLFEYGAPEDHLKWSPIFHAVAYGDVAEAQTLIENGADLTHRDTWERTPLLVAIQSGNTDKVDLLLEAGASLDERGRCGKEPMEFAIEMDDSTMLRHLLSKGINIEAYCRGEKTPLMLAAYHGAHRCVETLLELGADIHKTDRIQVSRKTAIEHTANPDTALLLVKNGGDIGSVQREIRLKLLNLGTEDSLTTTKDTYFQQKHRVFGKTNPERCAKAFWYDMVKVSCDAWTARKTFDDPDAIGDEPVWCYYRYGMSLTLLDNNEYIEIGGEHEDHYDPDFCIYNEVIHHRSDGSFDIYMYPKEVFPPTDFHSATLVGNSIFILGCLGYPNERKHGATPVYRLDTDTFEITKIDTNGTPPGWIYNHIAVLESKNTICIKGGERLEMEGGVEQHYWNAYDYKLNLDTMVWTRHESIPLSKEAVYFPEEFKQFHELEGTLHRVETNGQEKIVKLIEVYPLEVLEGQTIKLSGKEYTPTCNDFVFVIFCAESKPVEAANVNENRKPKVSWELDHYRAMLPTSFPKRSRFLQFEDVTKQEKEAFDTWLEGFLKGQSRID